MGKKIAAGVGFVVIFILAYMIGGSLTRSGFGLPFAILFFALLIGYVIWNLKGTKKTILADPARQQAALSFNPPADRAYLYLVRKGFIAMAAGMEISIDGQPRAQLKSPQFTMIELAPGAHRVGAAFVGGAGAQSKGDEQDITLAAGEVAGLQFTPHMGAIKGSVTMDRLNTAQVRQIVQGMKMVD